MVAGRGPTGCVRREMRLNCLGFVREWPGGHSPPGSRELVALEPATSKGYPVRLIADNGELHMATKRFAKRSTTRSVPQRVNATTSESRVDEDHHRLPREDAETTPMVRRMLA
jgi:hypothetical protein